MARCASLFRAMPDLSVSNPDVMQTMVRVCATLHWKI